MIAIATVLSGGFITLLSACLYSVITSGNARRSGSGRLLVGPPAAAAGRTRAWPVLSGSRNAVGQTSSRLSPTRNVEFDDASELDAGGDGSDDPDRDRDRASDGDAPGVVPVVLDATQGVELTSGSAAEGLGRGDGTSTAPVRGSTRSPLGRTIVHLDGGRGSASPSVTRGSPSPSPSHRPTNRPTSPLLATRFTVSPSAVAVVPLTAESPPGPSS